MMMNDDGKVDLESFIHFLQTTFATELRGGKSWEMEFITAFCAVPTNHHQLPHTYFHSDFCFLQSSYALPKGIVSIWP